jgi:hypothetical protein
MNLFYLDPDINKAVNYHCDKHVVKMCLETAQILCTALHRYGIAAPYKPTHIRHPTVLWAGDSLQHYSWLKEFGLALCLEYTWRYKKSHASEAVIKSLPTNPSIRGSDWREPPQAMPDSYKGSNTVEAYRRFYRGEKLHFSKWTNRPTPLFME